VDYLTGDFMQATIDGFMQNLTGALEDINTAAAQPNAKFEAFTNWDSLAALSVIVMINTEYSVEVSGTELKTCGTPAELFALVSTKLSACVN
jgi:acyl carrier protein